MGHGHGGGQAKGPREISRPQDGTRRLEGGWRSRNKVEKLTLGTNWHRSFVHIVDAVKAV